MAANFKRLPQDWIDIINTRYYSAPNRDAWADYNCAYRAYKDLLNIATHPLGNSIYDVDDSPCQLDIGWFSDLYKDRDCRRSSYVLGGDAGALPLCQGADAGILPAEDDMYSADAGMVPAGAGSDAGS
jgi:hypothetical protein